MHARTRVAIVCLAAALGAAPAHAQLSSAVFFVDADAGVVAVDENVPLEDDLFFDGPRSADVFLQSGTIPWDLFVAAGGAQAGTIGTIEYVATNTSQIFLRGQFSYSALASFPASATAAFDAVVRMDFRVAVPTAYTLTGYVSTAVALDDPEVASCQINGVVLAGDTRATPLPAGTYPILADRFLYPEETASLECSAKASGALGDSNELAFEVAVNGLPEPDAALASLAGVGSVALLGRRRARA